MRLKNIFLSSLCGLTFGFGQVAHADDAQKEIKHPVFPCLWEVSGKGLEKPSFLFGTCHSSDPRITTLHPKAQKAYEASDAVYGEIKISPEDIAKVGALMVRKDGKTVSAHVGEDLAGRANTLLKDINPALSLQAGLDSLQTWAVAAQLPQLEKQLGGDKVLDAILLETAASEGKHTEGLETMESQIAAFAVMSSEQEVLFFEATVEHMEHGEEIESVEDVYLFKDPEDIGEYVKEYMTLHTKGEEASDEKNALGELLKHELLDKRNREMAEKMSGHLQASPEQTHFFAVGAAHYTGETAIQDLLGKEGYTITPLYK